MKKLKKRDNIIYFGLISLICFPVFLFQFYKTKDVCPHSGDLFFAAGSLSLIIFLVGKNISRMAKKESRGWDVVIENSIITLLLISVGVVTWFYLYFCLEF